ncbi:MAG: PilZ domain-containing protein [Bryobacteraceae bacterium]
MPRVNKAAGKERRSELRCAADLEIRLRPEGLMSAPVEGHILDVAKSGFRARHSSHAIVSGQVVEFEFEGGEGRARVVWTRILGDQIESGFQVLAGER